MAGTGLAVVSGAAGWGTAHRVLAAVALPPLAALAVMAWVSARRLLPVALLALVLFGFAALLTMPGVHLAFASLALRRHRRRRGGRIPRRAARRSAARLRDADEAADHVAAASHGRRRRLRRRRRRAVGAGLCFDDDRAGARVRRCVGAQPLSRSRHRQADGVADRAAPRRVRPGARAARARVRPRALGVLVRAARFARQPADRAARARGQPLLRPRLHPLAQAVDAAEHRHRRRRRRRSSARRLCRRRGPSRLGRARHVRASSSSGRRRISGHSR